MSYGQKNYSQKIGSSDDTIAESGALLTAFANLLEKFGYEWTPEEVSEKVFNPENGLFLGDVSRLIRTVSITSRGAGAPNDPNSIVRFEYDSELTGGRAITYAVIASIEDKTIIDSYDGEVRQWSVYGEPVAYVTFTDDKGFPLTVTPLRAPEPAPAPVEVFYTLKNTVAGYATAEDAENRTAVLVNFAPGTYTDVTDSESGMKKLAPNSTSAGFWINPADDTTVVEDEPTEQIDPNTTSTGHVSGSPVSDTPAESVATDDIQTEPEEDTSVPVRFIPKDTEAWKKSWKPFLGPVKYVAKRMVIVTDLDKKFGDVELPAGVNHDYSGKFTGPDGLTYLRTTPSFDANNWYGVPEDALRLFQTEEEFDDMVNTAALNLTLDDESGISKAVKKVGGLEGKLRKYFKKQK